MKYYLKIWITVVAITKLWYKDPKQERYFFLECNRAWDNAPLIYSFFVRAKKIHSDCWAVRGTWKHQNGRQREAKGVIHDAILIYIAYTNDNICFLTLLSLMLNSYIIISMQTELLFSVFSSMYFCLKAWWLRDYKYTNSGCATYYRLHHLVANW